MLKFTQLAVRLELWGRTLKVQKGHRGMGNNLELPAESSRLVAKGSHRFEFAPDQGPIVTEGAGTYQPRRSFRVTDVIIVEHRGDAVEVLIFGSRLTRRGERDLRCGLEWVCNEEFANQVAASFWASTDMPGGVRIGRRDEYRMCDGQMTRVLVWDVFVGGRYVGRARTRNLALDLAERHLQEA
jgi:hypothetical protein